MSWHTKTGITNYFTLLDDLVKIATATSVNTAVKNAAGTGYAVDEILTVVGGTSDPSVATIRVLTITGGGGTGPIGTVRVETGGAYTVNPPDLTTNAVTSSGSGVSATMTLTMLSNGWTMKLRTQKAASATVTGGSGGTGYTVGDDLTLDYTLIGQDTNAVFNVDTVSGGVVTGVTVIAGSEGKYDNAKPGGGTGAIATTVAPSGGTGCTLVVTYENMDAPLTEDQIVLLEGTGSGDDEVYVGISTYRITDTTGFETCYNWGLWSITSFNAGLPWYAQVSNSPGFSGTDGSVDESSVSPNGGAFVPLQPTVASQTITYWISVTSRRIVGVAKMTDVLFTQGHYASWYGGFQNQFGTSSEFPYPIYVSGCASRYNSWFGNTNQPFMSSICEVAQFTNYEGPAFYRHSTGVWPEVYSWKSIESGSRTATYSNYFLYPMSKLRDNDGNAGADQCTMITVTGGGLNWAYSSTSYGFLIPVGGTSGSGPNIKLYPTPDSGGDLRMLVPCTIIGSNASAPVELGTLGELDNVYWVSGAGDTGLSSEDLIIVGTDRHVCFPNGNQVDEWGFMAIKAD